MAKGDILILVEGERERKFFAKLNSLLPEKGIRMTLVPFRYNIYSLYREMEEYGFDIELEKAIQLSKRINPGEKKLLEEKRFEAKYLIFDLDLHALELPEEKRMEAIPKMLEVFNDDSDNGLLLLNYPMFESIREIHHLDGADTLPTFPVRNGAQYKREMDSNGRPVDLKHFSFDTYCDLLKDSLILTNSILDNPHRMPTRDEALKMDSVSVWKKQKELIDREQKVYCLNTSIQFLLAYFGFDKIKSWMDKSKK
jgi:hypothetical protein